jgi:hypothetical protein
VKAIPQVQFVAPGEAGAPLTVASSRPRDNRPRPKRVGDYDTAVLLALADGPMTLHDLRNSIRGNRQLVHERAVMLMGRGLIEHVNGIGRFAVMDLTSAGWAAVDELEAETNHRQPHDYRRDIVLLLAPHRRGLTPAQVNNRVTAALGRNPRPGLVKQVLAAMAVDEVIEKSGSRVRLTESGMAELAEYGSGPPQ